MSGNEASLDATTFDVKAAIRALRPRVRHQDIKLPVGHVTITEYQNIIVWPEGDNPVTLGPRDLAELLRRCSTNDAEAHRFLEYNEEHGHRWTDEGSYDPDAPVQPF